VPFSPLLRITAQVIIAFCCEAHISRFILSPRQQRGRRMWLETRSRQIDEFERIAASRDQMMTDFFKSTR
jgi:hypothetical protein